MKLAQGLGVSQGKVKGRVRIVKSTDEPDKFSEGYILVTRMTNPAMVAVMNKAAGIICDIGGLTSHPSIVSREMGIPCIVAAKCIETGKPVTEILQDGQIIEMCGITGEIHSAEDESQKLKLRWK